MADFSLFTWALLAWTFAGMYWVAVKAVVGLINFFWRRWRPESYFRADLYTLARLSRRLNVSGTFWCENLQVLVNIRHTSDGHDK